MLALFYLGAGQWVFGKLHVGDVKKKIVVVYASLNTVDDKSFYIFHNL